MLFRTLIVLLLLLCSESCIIPESIFQLAENSRLPRWFAPPEGLSRRDVTVSMADYGGPSGRSAVFRLWDGNGHKLFEVTAKTDGYEPFTFGPRSPHGGFDGNSYPLYELDTARGIAEVIEHRHMEPVFYVNDDPAVRNALERRAAGAGKLK